MRKPTTKLLSEVIPASALRADLTGFAIRLHRHPKSFRAFPHGQTRLLLMDGSPLIASRQAALDLLTQYARGQIVLPTTPTDSAPLPRKARKPRAAKGVLDNPTDLFAAVFADELARAERRVKRLEAERARRAKHALPVVEKLLPDAPTVVIRDKAAAYRDDLEGIIARGEVHVRRFACNRHPGLPRKGAGVMPGHLNPVTIDRVDPVVLLLPEEA